MNIEHILSTMSLEEKVALCSGKDFWHTKEVDEIPALSMCDGPHGLRKQEYSSNTTRMNNSKPATCFPTAVTTSMSWNTHLLAEIGNAIAEEAMAEGVGLVLGPGANLKRNPLCGRNFEYFSEDPYLAGKLAAAFIQGLESAGTASSLKHFACNSQEVSRFSSNGIIDERTLHELYLAGFEIAVKEGRPSTVMCAYPMINGVHCSDDKKLLAEILRDNWGFDGMVVSDWGAMNDRIAGFKAGCDLSMPGGSDYMEKDAIEAVRNGSLSEESVNTCARRVLALMIKAAQNLEAPVSIDTVAHHALAVVAAESGATLLKNENELLPLGETQKIVLIGPMAKNPRYQGAGSSHVNARMLVSPADTMSHLPYCQGCNEDGSTTAALIEEAVSAAQTSDVAVVFAGLPDCYEAEGFDRDNMMMPEGHNRMIEAVAAVCDQVVVVLSCGAPVECPWADKVSAILYLGLAGEGIGEATRNLLFGEVSPSGRLAETWPKTYGDCPSSACYGSKDALYEEGLYVGYRYYDKVGVEPRWPFGYGLTYTSFAYSGLIANDNDVTVTVKNTGSRPGSEVVQLYIKPPQDGPYRPLRELKGFVRVFLDPGEEKTVRFSLDERTFAIWNDGWVVPAGSYGISIDNLHATIDIVGESLEIPSWQTGSWYEHPHGKPSRAAWEAMCGVEYSESVASKGTYTMDNSPMEMRKDSFVMKIMYKAVEHAVAKGFDGKKNYADPEFKMIMMSSAGGPLRVMQINGGIKGGILPGMLEIANGHILTGVKKMFRG